MATGYIKDIEKIGAFERAWDAWVDRENAPACICVEASAGSKKHDLLELGMVVAIPRKQSIITALHRPLMEFPAL